MTPPTKRPRSTAHHTFCTYPKTAVLNGTRKEKRKDDKMTAVKTAATIKVLFL
jgi:hypothetical protein